MKSNILFFAIPFFVLLFTLNGNAQIIDQSPQLKNAETNNATVSTAEKGDLVEVSVYSPGLEGNILGDSPYRKTMVYLPPGYHSNPDKHYPVVYLFAGKGGKGDGWFVGENYKLQDTLNNLINQGELNPFILVSPDNYNKYVGSWFSNSSLSGNWEDFNAFDLVKYVDDNFRTIPLPTSRGISGYSMGGYGAVKLALKHPDIFSLLYSISGVYLDFADIFINPEIPKDGVMPKDGIVRTAKLNHMPQSIDSINNYSFDMAIAFSPNKNAIGYGELPFTKGGELIDSTWQKWLKHDPASLVPDYLLKKQRLSKITLECGTKESGVHKFHLTFSDSLTKYGINHKLNIHNGNHSFSYYNRMGSYVFPFFSKNLQQAIVDLKGEKCLNNTDSLAAQFYIDGILYIVPFETANEENDILTNQLKSVETAAFSEVKMPLSDFNNGIYKVVGISNEGYISSPLAFSVVSETPKINILVSDFASGSPLENCNINVNGEPFSTDKNGELNLQGCGKHSVMFSLENYYIEDTTFSFFTDTTISIALVHDSYIKIIDRVSLLPLPNIAITNKAYSTKTDGNGFGDVIQNFKNETFTYSIPQSARYFSEEGTVNLNPGDTAIIKLTKRIATVEFLIQNKSGELTDQKLIVNGKEYSSDEEGIIKVRNIDARQMCTYSIENPEYISIVDSVYIEIDTLVNIMLLSTSIKDMEAENFFIFPNPVNDVLTIHTNDFTNASVEITSITGKLIYSSKINETEHQIDLSSFKSGIYFIRFKNNDLISTKKIIKI